MQQIMTNTSKVLVDQRGGSNLLYLPLDKLMQMTGTGTADAAKPPEAPAAQEPTTARSKETRPVLSSQRSR